MKILFRWLLMGVLVLGFVGCGGGGGTAPETPTVEENTTTPKVEENTTTPTVEENTTKPTVEKFPVFQNSATVTVAENQTTAITINATDEDSTTLTYSINSTEFDIDSTTGVVTFKTAPNYEVKNSYSFIATASDGVNDTNQSVTITIIDVNEAPTFTSPTNSATVAENQTTAITINATDEDSPTLTYSINSTEFDIDSTTGVVTFKTAPNYEVKNSYSFIATASDGVNDTNQSVTINISNIAEVVPSLEEYDSSKIVTFSDFSFSGDANWRDEGSETYSNLDIDDSQKSCIIHIVEVGGLLSFDWNVSSEEDWDYLNFDIDGERKESISGTISMTRKSYKVVSGSELIWCYIKDTGDSSNLDKGWIRDIHITQYYSIDENASVGESVGFVNIKSIADSDIDTFSLEGSGSEHFSIDASGEITLASSVDYETQRFYYLTTKATNEAGESNAVDVNISIVDDKNDLYIQSAVLDDNATPTIDDDRVFIFFSKGVESSSLSIDKFNIYGDGVIEGVGVYSNSWSAYDISLSNSATALGKEDNISIDNVVDATDTYTLYYETKTIIENIDKFSRVSTGQTTSYIENGDANLSIGLTQAYIDNNDGTITDKNRGLMWQKEDDNTTRTHSLAISYCEDLDFATYSDWRLPTIDELVSITDKGRSTPAINPLFTNTNTSFYWSSTDSVNSDDALGIYFSDSHDDTDTKSNLSYVRCVRD